MYSSAGLQERACRASAMTAFSLSLFSAAQLGAIGNVIASSTETSTLQQGLA